MYCNQAKCCSFEIIFTNVQTFVVVNIQAAKAQKSGEKIGFIKILHYYQKNNEIHAQELKVIISIILMKLINNYQFNGCVWRKEETSVVSPIAGDKVNKINLNTQM